MPTQVQTMFTVSIGGNSHDFSCESVDRNWVVQQLIHFHRQGISVCIRIHVPALNRRFTSGCPTVGGSGVGGPLTAVERKLIAEWKRVGSGVHDPNTGQLIRFLNLLCPTV